MRLDCGGTGRFCNFFSKNNLSPPFFFSFSSLKSLDLDQYRSATCEVLLRRKRIEPIADPGSRYTIKRTVCGSIDEFQAGCCIDQNQRCRICVVASVLDRKDEIRTFGQLANTCELNSPIASGNNLNAGYRIQCAIFIGRSQGRTQLGAPVWRES